MTRFKIILKVPREPAWMDLFVYGITALGVLIFFWEMWHVATTG